MQSGFFQNTKDYNTQRFIDAQDSGDGVGTATFPKAYSEMIQGKKASHWIWYVFPQPIMFTEYGLSERSEYFSIKSVAEVKEYCDNEILMDRLVIITSEVFEHLINGENIEVIFGSLDAEKFISCMKLFAKYSDESIFGDVLDTLGLESE